MNLEAIKARLAKLNESGSGGEDTRKYFWTAPMGKSIIRIVPSAYSPDDVATELQFHNKLSKYPILSLTNFNKLDPVEEFRAKLREQGGKDNWSLNGKLTPSSRYMIPVIVRGEEDKGVRLWSVGILIYKALIRLAADDEIGDFTDVVDGYDVKVTKVEGNPYPETSIDLARKSSPLSEDPKQVELWLKEQPEPIKCFRESNFDYIKKQLETYLNGGIQSQVPKIEPKQEEPKLHTAPKESNVEISSSSVGKNSRNALQEFDDVFANTANNSDGNDDLDGIFSK